LSIFGLIKRFSTRATVPVEVEEIVDFIRRLKIKDEIYFWEADISSDVLTATVMHWEYPDGSGGCVNAVDIYTARSLPLDELRLAQVKELLHILDPVQFRCNTLEDVEALIENIVLPPDLVDYDEDDVHGNSDRAALFHALAVLFPWAARDAFMPAYQAGKITLTEIASYVALPVPHVKFVMSDQWPEIHYAMMGPERPRLPDKVHTLDADGSPIEIYSVSRGTDPYAYAKEIEVRKRGVGKPIAAFLIESGGVARTFSATEVASYIPRNAARR
jgi:hypothetical protein